MFSGTNGAMGKCSNWMRPYLLLYSLDFRCEGDSVSQNHHFRVQRWKWNDHIVAHWHLINVAIDGCIRDLAHNDFVRSHTMCRFFLFYCRRRRRRLVVLVNVALMNFYKSTWRHIIGPIHQPRKKQQRQHYMQMVSTIEQLTVGPLSVWRQHCALAGRCEFLLQFVFVRSIWFRIVSCIRAVVSNGLI